VTRDVTSITKGQHSQNYQLAWLRLIHDIVFVVVVVVVVVVVEVHFDSHDDCKNMRGTVSADRGQI